MLVTRLKPRQAMVAKAFEKDKQILEKIGNLPKNWAMGSTCSGTGNFELAVRAVVLALNAAIEGRAGEIQVHGVETCLLGIVSCRQSQVS